MSTAVKAHGSTQHQSRVRRRVTRIVPWLSAITLLVLVPFAIFFIAAVLYAAAKAGG